ncbi:MAG: ChbG/HpnK family deacetylase [Rhizobiales bacterium]|nr:ChbG/HpnK family deacetylase [Hyphomicrobiales bacterium]
MSPPPRFRFALCADDYALSPAVSRGIREAIAAGAVTATGAMTNRPSWPQAARELSGLEGRAEIGLHLNLTLGAPLAPMPRLAPHGALPTIREVIAAARAGRLPEAELRAEIDRQLDAFAAAAGAPPAFVDGHQHVHALPGVRAHLFDALAARGWRPWLRDCGDRPGRILRRRVSAAKALALALLSRGFRAGAERRGFLVNDGFSGFSGFDPGADYPAQFARYLVAPGRRHLVMCHPGHVDDELAAVDPVTTSRERELAFFLSPAFAEVCARAGAAPVQFSPISSRLTPP